MCINPLICCIFRSETESEVEVTDEISIDDLLGNVNRDSFFRYSGSLTTPSCNEAVVWTVFKESVKVDQDLVCFTHQPQRPTHKILKIRVNLLV